MNDRKTNNRSFGLTSDTILSAIADELDSLARFCRACEKEIKNDSQVEGRLLAENAQMSLSQLRDESKSVGKGESDEDRM